MSWGGRPDVLLFAVGCGLALSVLATGLAPVEAATPSTITGCTTIDSPGTYVLEDDIEDGSVAFGESCIVITASDVVLDGNGYAVAGPGGEFTDGVVVPSDATARNVTVRNLRVRNWTNGIVVSGASDVVVADVRIRRTESGATFTDVDGLDVVRTRVEAGLTDIVDNGVTVDGGRNVVLDGVVVRAYPDGVFITGANGTILRDSHTAGNAGRGVVVAGAPVRDVRVVNVTARHNGDGVVLSGGRDFSDAPDELVRNVTVTDSRITGSERDGIRVSSFGTRDPVLGSTLSNSTVLASGRHGVNLTAGSDGTRIRKVFVANSSADGVLIGDSADVRTKNLTSRGNGEDGIDVRAAGTTVDGATVRDNRGLEIAAPSASPGLRLSELETAVGTFAEVRLRAGGLASPRPASYPERAALPGVLNVTTGTDLVEFTLQYEGSDLPADADESTLALFNATDTAAPVELSARIDTDSNTVAANVSGDSGGPLAAGGRIELVALANVSSEATATIAVSGLDAPGTVTRGDRLNVSATLENVGDAAGTVTAAYRINGTAVSSRSVTLDAGMSRTVAFDLTAADTSGVPLGNVTHGVYTGSDDATATLRVEEATPAEFSVSALRTPARLTRGEPITVAATLENVGEQADTRTVAYRVDGSTVASESTRLRAGASTTVEFPVDDTSGFPLGNVTHGVHTDDDTATATLRVADPSASPNLTVRRFDAPDRVTRGQVLRANATVENAGNAPATATVRYRIDGTSLESASVALDAGNTTTVRFVVPGSATGTLPTGTRRQVVATPNDTATSSIEVRTAGGRSAEFSVSAFRAPEDLTRGEPITVDATIRNLGDARESTTATYEIDGTAYGRRTVTIAPGDATTVTFTLEGNATAELPPEAVTHGVYTANASATATLNVVAARVDDGAPNPTLSAFSAPETAIRGERLNVSATLENPGNGTTTATAAYRIDGTAVSSQSVTLDAGVSRTVAFNLTAADTSGVPLGNVTHGVYLDDGSASSTGSVAVTNANTDGPGALAPSLAAPTDPDGDGLYEDVTGDGRFSIVDVAAFLDLFDDEAVTAQPRPFDFNDDGKIDILDVATLLGET